MGSTAPSATGSRKLWECQLAASGPVSASPSPITTAATSSGVVEDGSVGVRQRIAELPALVDGPGSFRRCVAGDTAGVGELPEQLRHALLVVAHSAVDLRVGALKPGVGHHGGAAVARPGDEQHLLPVPADGAVQVGVDEVEPGVVPQWPSSRDLVSSAREGFTQQRVGAEIDLADGQVVGRPPPAVHEFKFDFVSRPLAGAAVSRRADSFRTGGVRHGPSSASVSAAVGSVLPHRNIFAAGSQPPNRSRG